jgi:hypothetical protein
MLNHFCRGELKAAVRPKSKEGYYPSSYNQLLATVTAKLKKIYPEYFHSDKDLSRLKDREFFDEPITPIPMSRFTRNKP